MVLRMTLAENLLDMSIEVSLLWIDSSKFSEESSTQLIRESIEYYRKLINKTIRHD